MNNQSVLEIIIPFNGVNNQSVFEIMIPFNGHLVFIILPVNGMYKQLDLKIQMDKI